MSTNPTTYGQPSDTVATQPSTVGAEILGTESTIARRCPKYLWCKRAVDIGMTVPLLIIAIPIILLAGLINKLTSRGPILYWQTRVGLSGREFQLCKLRTMVHNAEALTGPVWATADDSRITRFGVFLRRIHIDELPQLFNVLMGQMSLVGPRPERPEFVAKLEWELNLYSQRLDVRPGITGLAQLRLPPDSSIDSVSQKLEYDLYYVQHFGGWLDLRILVFTAVYLIHEIGKMVWSLFALPVIDHNHAPRRGEIGLARIRSPQQSPLD